MNKEPHLSSEKLDQAAERAALQSHLLASCLARYKELHTITEDDLLAELRCDEDTLNRLRLCSLPDPDPTSFRIDIKAIAERFGVDAVKLTSIVRKVEIQGAFDEKLGSALARDKSPQLVREEPEEYGVDESDDQEPATGDQEPNP